MSFYKDMLMIRRFEEKAGQLYGMGLIGGFCHLYIGQEAVVVGMTQAGKAVDTVITAYRDHGHMLACRHGPQRCDGGTDRSSRRIFARQGAAPCTCFPAKRISSVAMGSLARKCRSAPGSPSRTNTKKTAASAIRIPATARSTRAKFMRALTWARTLEASHRLCHRKQ